ncbi:alpha/beta hydrolase [Pseudaminobacter sp. NGMCC 1.201702]|uniref:alpha/beta hydrolase n=1 Tax=Pseudaminobacter sp. NGMCC 1.201702 TaxID=3391825 RepID=UPI0039EEB139
MLVKFLFGAMSALVLLASAGVADARDLSDCERNGSQAQATKTGQPRTAVSSTEACREASAAQTKSMPAKASVDVGSRNGGVLAPPAISGSLLRAKDFVVLVKRPQNATAETIVLLHGSGGDETTLMSLASRAAPRSVLMGVRGRITQDGRKRWYRRLTPTKFDQRDIRAEAAAFADFIEDAVESRALDLSHTTFIGYSNGANLLAAMTLLHPGLIERAVLLRPMSVLDKIPAVDLSNVRLLMVAGLADTTYAPFAPALETMLEEHGANLDARFIKADHGLGGEDVKIVSEWLDRSNAVSLN